MRAAYEEVKKEKSNVDREDHKDLQKLELKPYAGFDELKDKLLTKCVDPSFVEKKGKTKL